MWDEYWWSADVSVVVIISKAGWYKAVVVRSCSGTKEGIGPALRGYGFQMEREKEREVIVPGSKN